MTTKDLQNAISSHELSVAPLLSGAWKEANLWWLDLSVSNPEIEQLTSLSSDEFWQWIVHQYRLRQVDLILGGYNEHRIAYRKHSALFGSEAEARCIHLGIDLWVLPETVVQAPVAGIVHSFADNAGAGNYGPTIILEHQCSAGTFYTLYGHLSRKSLTSLSIGQSFAAGDALAQVGIDEENGGWAPHLHFQVMFDMLGMAGDFPGVCSLHDRARMLENCPDPVVLFDQNYPPFSGSNSN